MYSCILTIKWAKSEVPPKLLPINPPYFVMSASHHIIACIGGVKRKYFNSNSLETLATLASHLHT